MEQRHYLIDTNVIIDFLGNKLPPVSHQLISAIIDRVPQLSVITKIEILSFETNPKDASLLHQFIQDAQVHSISEEVTLYCIEIRKEQKTKLPDALIAATALCHNCVLVTRNVNDFRKIKNLSLLNPFQIV